MIYADPNDLPLRRIKNISSAVFLQNSSSFRALSVRASYFSPAILGFVHQTILGFVRLGTLVHYTCLCLAWYISPTIPGFVQLCTLVHYTWLRPGWYFSPTIPGFVQLGTCLAIPGFVRLATLVHYTWVCPAQNFSPAIPCFVWLGTLALLYLVLSGSVLQSPYTCTRLCPAGTLAPLYCLCLVWYFSPATPGFVRLCTLVHYTWLYPSRYFSPLYLALSSSSLQPRYT